MRDHEISLLNLEAAIDLRFEEKKVKRHGRPRRLSTLVIVCPFINIFHNYFSQVLQDLAFLVRRSHLAAS